MHHHDNGNPPDDKLMVYAYMDPVMKIAEALSRALGACLKDGTLSTQQITALAKAINTAKAEIDNELMDIQENVEAMVKAGEIGVDDFEAGETTSIPYSKVFKPRRADSTPSHDFFTETEAETATPKPTHTTSRKVN